MSTFNPTLRLVQRRYEGIIDVHKIETLDGVKLMSGLSASTVIEQKQTVSLRSDDVFICTYPKCGTTWMQQIVKLITTNGIENGIELDVFAPWIEHMTVEEIESMSSPRFFKTHLPYQLMASGGDPAKTNAKYIYVLRNPKDAAISSYAFLRKVYPHFSTLTWESFLDKFIEGDVIFGAFYNHFLSWWCHRDSPNILLLSYEQMKRDLSSVVTTVSSFMGYNLTDDVIQSIVKQSNFESMKTNTSANKDYMNPYTPGKTPFMRKGVVGDWRNVFTDEQSVKMDAIVADKLGNCGLVFDYGE